MGTPVTGEPLDAADGYGRHMDLGLDQRVALVVGGTGYLGTAISTALRAEGAVVVTASRSGDGDLTVDATDQASVDAALARVAEQHGRLDVLVVSAAPSARTLDPHRLDEPDTVREGLDAKSLTFLRLAQAAVPVMAEAGFGRIVGISGQNAYLTGNTVGAVRNAALNLAAKNLADAHAGSGITVNTVNPGPVVDEPSAEVTAGRPGDSSPEQIAALVAFLASTHAATISGEAISTGHKLRGLAVI